MLRIDITYEFCGGELPLLTFTMAWIRFRFFEPIAHPDSVVVTSSAVPPLVVWCAERALKGTNHKELLSAEQLYALQDAAEIAEDTYSSNEHFCLNHLAQRLVWGSPFQSSLAAPPIPIPPPPHAPAIAFGPQPVVTSNMAPPVALPNFPWLGNVPRRRRIHNRWEILERIRTNLTPGEAKDLLSKDNELRTLAAIGMPEEANNLNIKDCSELRIHFALQDSATKIMSLASSLQDRLK
jgi:hypothetical protein